MGRMTGIARRRRFLVEAARPAAGFLVVASVLVAAFFAACGEKPLRARQVTAATAAVDLFGGSESTGGSGDWALTNGVVQVIVDDVGWQADVLAAVGAKLPMKTITAPSGGQLVDLGYAGENNDQLSVYFPIANYDTNHPILFVPASEALGNSSLGSIVPAVDTTAGVASLTVYGFVVTDSTQPLTSQRLTVKQVYSVQRGETFLRIHTEITNTDPVNSLPMSGIADLAVIGPGGAAPFVPWPNGGFNILSSSQQIVPFVTAFGLNVPSDGPLDASGGYTGETSYAISAPDDPRGPYLLSATRISTLGGGSVPTTTPLPPAGVFTWDRRVYVGRSGDVDGAARPALKAFSAKKGYSTGTVSGSIATPDATPFRASVEITQVDMNPSTPDIETIVSDVGGVGSVPITQIRTNDALGGSFSTTLPVGRYTLRVKAESRQTIGPITFDVSPNATTPVGPFTLSSDGTLLFEIRDTATNDLLPARLTIKGKNVPDPAFGPPYEVLDAGTPLRLNNSASIPSGNTTYAPTGGGQIQLAPGDYRLIASRGPEYDITSVDVTVPAGGSTSATLTLPRQVDTTGWFASDFHVHAAPSADTAVPPRDRVASLAGEGVEVMVSSDHDQIFDYAPVIDLLGMGTWIRSIVGTELTSNTGPAPFALGVGHFNGWPLVVDPTARKNGTPEDDGVEPNVLYDRLRSKGAQVVQMNHPEWDVLGFLSTLGYDPTAPLTMAPNNFLLRPSMLGTGTRNIDFDAIELLNGLSFPTYKKSRDIWMSFLDQGYVITATAASDTHRVAGTAVGLPRTYVKVPSDAPADFDVATFDASLHQMAASGTSGPFVTAELLHGTDVAGIGQMITATTGPLQLHVRVQAPCWIPVGDLRVYANGTLYLTQDINAPCTSAVRFDGTFTLTPAVDTAYVVEEEERLPRDTSTFYKQVSNYLYQGMTFLAFTNPLFVDVDGNGHWDPPGF
jgi:hypothetical protein